MLMVLLQMVYGLGY